MSTCDVAQHLSSKVSRECSPMKILAVSDQRLPRLHNADFLRRQYSDVNAVVSCGDLDVDYLDFIVSVLSVQLYYVRGNHDHHEHHQHFGGIDLHRRLILANGITMAGLEGSINYNNSGVQYSDGAMAVTVLSMMPLMLFRRLTNKHAVDLFVAHSPPRHVNDAVDRAHRGFRAFRWLIRWGKPRYFIHGHIDLYDQRIERKVEFHDTCVININPQMLIDLNDQ